MFLVTAAFNRTNQKPRKKNGLNAVMTNSLISFKTSDQGTIKTSNTFKHLDIFETNPKRI